MSLKKPALDPSTIEPRIASGHATEDEMVQWKQIQKEMAKPGSNCR